ncbi:SDR family oxidoreductase [Naasia sp. SYSU D00057]|uniref:SDR family oxidoreductase n=1 Tax=Naasia sp. SYSU D00057 TaxID=2817380 RepID=UPI001B311026|nr:SDR family oxidoreductase [Naasia sp. SYSU D00057]
MTIVVTGATGNLGSLIVEHLIARGVTPEQVVATGRSEEKLGRFSGTGVRTAVLDYDRPETIAAALEGATAIVLVSGSEVGRRVQQHAAVVDAAKRAGVRHLVYTSAPKADSSDLPLAPDHEATEDLVRQSGIPFTILRNNWYTENYAKPLADAEQSGEYAASTGDGRIASATRDEYAEAAAVVLTTPGHDNAVYELSGDEPWTGADLASAMTEILGRPVRWVPLSTDEHRERLAGFGLDEGTIGFVTALDASIRGGALDVAESDLSRLLGRPALPLVEGLRRAAA